LMRATALVILRFQLDIRTLYAWIVRLQPTGPKIIPHSESIKFSFFFQQQRSFSS